MAITNLYRTLFKIELLHHYFLDNGEVVYGTGSSSDEIAREESNRRNYTLSDFFEIEPTAKTKQLLKNWKATCRIQNDGIIVGIKALPTNDDPPQASVDPFIPFDDSFVLDFTIKVSDQYFENYTDIVWDKSKLIYLSNREPAPTDPPLNEGDPIPVACEFSYLTGYATETGGADINVDLHKDIDKTELIGMFGLIRVHLEGDDNTKLWLVQQSNTAKMVTTPPVLSVYLKNRETRWYYYSQEDGSLLFPNNNNQDQLRALTLNGHTKLRNNGQFSRYPNPNAKLIIYNSSDEDYYSEIFI